jgi:hypothetical protein
MGELNRLMWQRCKNDSLILANLTQKEYRRFQNARLMYSGSTGENANPKLYNGIAPYIATFLFNLKKVKKALRWKHPRLNLRGNQWILKRRRR